MFLLTFEGLDGSGKSTQIRLLADWLIAEGYPVTVLREPGGTRLSEEIRDLLLDPASRIEPFPELLLFSAARAQLVSERIKPLLESGSVVICDRFYDSTTAYQGAGRGLADPVWLDGFHRLVTGGLTPRRTYLMEISPEEARVRRLGRSDEDRMEASGTEFYRRVAEGYRSLAGREPERVRVLDGSAPVESISEAIRDDVRALLRSIPGTETNTPG
jgi:dTMP kinase